MFFGIISLLIAQFSGSTIVPIATKIGVGYLNPLAFLFVRFLFATLLFLPVFIFTKKKKLFLPDYKRFSFLAGLLFINVSLFTIGIQYTTVIISQIFYSASPVLVGIFAFLILGEKPSRNKIIGLTGAFFGVGFIIFESAHKQASLSFGTLLGNALILIAILGYSGWIIYSRILSLKEEYSSYQTTFFTFFFIAVYSLVLLFVWRILPFSKNIEISTRGIISAFIVAFGSAILYFFMQVGIKKTSAFGASIFQYFGPFFSGIVAVPLLHEKPTPLLFLGGLLILAGVFYATTYDYLVQILRKRQKE